MYNYTEIKLLNKFKMIVDNLCNCRILVVEIAIAALTDRTKSFIF